MLDVLVIIVVLAFVGIGYLSGILHEGLTICALAFSYFASASLEGPIGALVLSVGWPGPAMAYTLGRVLGGVLIYVSLRVAIHIADRRFGRTRQGVLQPWNRNLGAFAGLLFGLGLGCCILCIADAAYKACPECEGRWAKAAQASALRKLVAPYNPADRLLVTDSLKLIRLAKDRPARLEELRQTDLIRKLIDHPTIQEILADAELMDAIHARDVKRVARDEKIHALLKDRELRRMIFSEEVRAALRETLAEWEEEAEGEQAPAHNETRARP